MWLAFVAHDISLFVRTALDLTIAYRQIRGQVSMLTPGRCNQQNLDSEKLYRTKNLDSSICYAKSLQSCPTLCDPIDGSPSSSPVPGILQARTLEWVAISFSNACKWKVKVKSLSRVWLLATPWTTAYQAPLSTGFSRQEYWSGVPLPSPTILLPTV